MVDFNFEVSKSPTIHLETKTLKRVEQLRQILNEQKGKNLSYDAVIQHLLKTKGK